MKLSLIHFGVGDGNVPPHSRTTIALLRFIRHFDSSTTRGRVNSVLLCSGWLLFWYGLAKCFERRIYNKQEFYEVLVASKPGP